MKEKVLVVAVHPDDETLACGGTLLKHRSQGDVIYWLIVTNAQADESFAKRREREISTVAGLYGFKKTFRLGFPATGLDKVPGKEIIAKIAAVFNEVKPSVVYVPFRGDVHSDHRVIFEASYSCVKTFRYPFIKKVLMMETISETEFSPSLKESSYIPNYFVDISKFLARKILIMKTFESEIQKHPFPRSLKNIKALATFRGAMAACQAAESFMLLKEIC